MGYRRGRSVARRGSDWIALLCMCTAILVGPLAFGAAHETTQIFLAALTVISMTCWLLAGGVPRPTVHPGWILSFFLGVWIAFLVLPLPPTLIAVLGPSTDDLLRVALPGWPQTPGYPEVGGTDGPFSTWRPLSLSAHLARGELVRWFVVVGTFLVVAYFPWSRRSRSPVRIAQAVLAVALVEAIVALYQAVTGSSMIYGFEKPATAPWPSGTYVNRNHLAGLLEMGLPIALGLGVERAMRLRADLPPWREGPLVRRIREIGDALTSPRAFDCAVYGLAGVVILVALYRSLSRAGMLCPIAAALILTPWFPAGRGWQESRRLRARALTLATVGGAIAFAALFPDTLARLQVGTENSGLTGRIASYRAVTEMIGDFPVFGVGPGAFSFVYPLYGPPAGARLLHAHNDYLELAAENGIPVLAAALAVIVLFHRRALRALGEADRDHRPLLWACLVGATSLLLHSLVDFNLQIPANAAIFAVSCGLVFRLSNGRAGRADLGRKGRLALVTILLLGAAWLAPVLNAQAAFRHLYPATELLPPRDYPGRQRTSYWQRESLERLLGTDPNNPFIRYELGGLLQRIAAERFSLRQPIDALLTDAARHYVVAARALPVWSRPHLQIARLSLAAEIGLSRPQASAALDRARHLDPHDRFVTRAVARTRRILLRGGIP